MPEKYLGSGVKIMPATARGELLAAPQSAGVAIRRGGPSNAEVPQKSNTHPAVGLIG
jgi:hypothetical protein